ncbi:MAG TPA: type II toxin-antitoxin system VapC family toxin [Thermoanaerobaculia bacterium]|nr:type II toxin-antitoxin system VapC family toxin [Thermoanaerobaculia bacterium]
MIALDTNVLVRVVTADHPEQLALALEVLQSGELWVSKTVLLETEWVLRYSYELSPDVILETLRRLLGYRNLQVEDRGAVLQAFSLVEAGMDFADSLHLASSADAERFATFDRTLAKLARKAQQDGLPPVDLLGAGTSAG